MNKCVYYLSVNIEAEIVDGYYKGQVSTVFATADSGETIQLPIRYFRPFMSSVGVRGRFRLITQPSGKFVDLIQVN